MMIWIICLFPACVTLEQTVWGGEMCNDPLVFFMFSAAYKVTVKSSAAEGDFMTYTASVVEVLKNADKSETHTLRTAGISLNKGI